MQIKLLAKKHEEGNVISFIFEKPADLNYQAGQFFRYKLPNSNPDERGENRFFTNPAPPFENKIQISTRVEEEKSSTFKKDLAGLKPGDTIEASGPKGDFILKDPRRKTLFIAAGIGITPFRSMLLQLDHNNQPLNIILLYAIRDKNAFFKKEFEKLAKKHPEFKIIYIVSAENTEAEKLTENIKIIPGKLDADLIKNLVPGFKDYIFYTSGPEPMVEDLEVKIADMGVRDENSIRDYFPGYEKY